MDLVDNPDHGAAMFGPKPFPKPGSPPDAGGPGGDLHGGPPRPHSGPSAPPYPKMAPRSGPASGAKNNSGPASSGIVPSKLPPIGPPPQAA